MTSPSQNSPTILSQMLFAIVALDFTLCPVTAQDSDNSNNDITEVSITDRVPFGRKPVDYFESRTNDAVSRLNQRLALKSAHLSSVDRFGYLHSVLDLLDVPVESQLLVYSKTARAPDLVSPKTPRAVFFNDEVSVAWIPEARELEITAVDPTKGINFYTLSQPLESSEPDSEAGKLKTNNATLVFQRRDRCLACHAGRSSLEVPGLLLRAFQTDRTGKPIVGFSRVTHAMDYYQRWGGWYVTGSPAGVIHRGNLVSKEDNARQKREPEYASSLDDLSQKLESAQYPFPDSDFVAHLVLAHQVQGTNLLIRTGMESRLKRRSDVESQLIRYFVFADEPTLDLSQSVATQVLSNSEFATSFVRRGPHDGEGRSLRELSLNDHVFKYRLSFLIHSRLFDELPNECRNRLLQRLWAGLTADSPPEDFRHITDSERATIASIVRATVPRLPRYWHGPLSNGK